MKQHNEKNFFYYISGYEELWQTILENLLPK